MKLKFDFESIGWIIVAASIILPLLYFVVKYLIDKI